MTTETVTTETVMRDDAAVVRLAVLSDSHLSPRETTANANWDATLRHIETTQPDLVVHTGDISLNGAGDLSDLRHARSQLDRLSVPWLAVPGNHDLGEPFDTATERIRRRRDAYEAAFGDRFWTMELGAWQLVGLDEHDNPVRYMIEPVRSRLRALLAAHNVRLVVSGHVHQWRSIVIDGTPHLWAPSTWATMGDKTQPVIGTKAVGIAEIALSDQATAEMRTPAGIDPAVLGETIPSPYHH